MSLESILMFNIDWKDFPDLFAKLKNFLYLITHIVDWQKVFFCSFSGGDQDKYPLLLQIIKVAC